MHRQFPNHVLKALFFYQNSPKIKLILQKNAKISRPRASGGWGLRPHTPKSAPSLRISGYAPASLPFKLTLDSNEMDEPGEISECFNEYFVQIGESIAKKAKLVNETNFNTFLNNSISQTNSSTYLVLMF